MKRILISLFLISTLGLAELPTKESAIIKAKETVKSKNISTLPSVKPIDINRPKNINYNDNSTYTNQVSCDYDKYITIIAQKDKEIANLIAEKKALILQSIKDRNAIEEAMNQKENKGSSVNIQNSIMIHSNPIK